MNIQWYKNDDKLLPGVNVKIETSDSESQLRLTKCQRKDTGEVKIKIKNEFGTIEAVSKLIVLGKFIRRKLNLRFAIENRSLVLVLNLFSIYQQTNQHPRRALWRS